MERDSGIPDIKRRKGGPAAHPFGVNAEANRTIAPPRGTYEPANLSLIRSAAIWPDINIAPNAGPIRGVP